MLADLHIHTCFSDGTMTPEAVAAQGAALGFGLLAVADHNSWESWERFAPACRSLGVRPLRGVELDCTYDGRDLHLLAYGFSPTPALGALAARSRQLLLEMSDDLVRRLLPLAPQLSWEEYRSFPFDPRQGGWQCLQYLLAKGVTASLPQGMRLYAQYGCGYDRYPFPPAAEVCAAVRQAGGVPVLAHPCQWFDAGQPAQLLAHLDALAALGVGGVECYYPANSPQMTRLCREYCLAHGLFITAGSDSHGAFGKDHHGLEYYIGAVKIDEKELCLGSLLPGQGNKKGEPTP